MAHPKEKGIEKPLPAIAPTGKGTAILNPAG